MQVSVEDINSVKKTLHIEIPEAEVVSELDRAYNELKKRAKVKGFRPGKVPRSVVVRMFKKDVHADVTSKLIQSSFLEALKEVDLKIVGTPQVDPPELEDSGPYKYEALVEVSPELEDIDYKGLSLKRTNYEVSDAEIDAQLKMLQKNLTRREKVEPARPARDGDLVLIDYEGFKDGEPFAETALTKNFTLKIGLGTMSEEFDKQLVGMQPEESKEFTVKFPNDFHNEKLQDLEISFQVTLNEIREEILPPIDDALAEKAGQKSLEDLKKVITDNLEQGYAKRKDQELQEQIYESLTSKFDFEVPDAMVDMELEGIVDEAERSFAYRNITLEEMGLTKESIAEKYRDTAVSQVKRHLILGKMIEQEKLSLTDDELEEELNEMAANFNQSVEEIKKYFGENKEKLKSFKHAILEKKAIKLIIDSSEIEDVEHEIEPAAEDESEKVSENG